MESKQFIGLSYEEIWKGYMTEIWHSSVKVYIIKERRPGSLWVSSDVFCKKVFGL